MNSFKVIGWVFLLIQFTCFVLSYPSDMVSTSGCAKRLDTSAVLMQKNVQTNPSLSITLKRGSTSLTSMGAYVSGETLVAHFINPPSGCQYLWETTNGRFTSGSCTGKIRAMNSDQSIVMPTNGATVMLWVISFVQLDK